MGSSLFLFPPWIFFARCPGMPVLRCRNVLWAAICIVTLALPPSVRGSVVINELYYDHPGKDAGYEFIELVNTDSLSINLSGYAIEFHNGAGIGWEMRWQAGAFDSIPSGGLFVIGGSNVFPRPDGVLELNLQNGPDAIRLVRSAIVVDLVGYGDLDDPAYVECESAHGVPAGTSIGRKPDGADTDNNRLDFYPMDPSPGGFNIPRRDVSVALATGTKRAAAVEVGSFEEIRFVLENAGIQPIADRAVAIELRDSSALGVRLIERSANPGAIPPGEACDMSLSAVFSTGYHHLLLEASYVGDERGKNNTIRLIRRAGTAPILVSEVMSYPNGPCPQYVEIYNAGIETYDVAGHSLRDASNRPSCITASSRTLDPGAYLVLAPDRESLLSCFPSVCPSRVVALEGAWPHLNRGSGGFGDSVVLADAFDIPLDAVAYPSQPSSARGMSLERMDLFVGAPGCVWVLSRDPRGGSPGERCMGALLEPPGKKTLCVSPNPFAPEAGEKLLISVNPAGEGRRAVVTIFDLSGRRVKVVGASTLFPYVFLWDGTAEWGRIVGPGLYVLACEVFSSGGGRMYVEKVVVGCGRKSR